MQFPDLSGCVTFGDTWDEAIDNATDVLAGWLTNAESKFIAEPSPYESLQKVYESEQLIPIPVDEKIMESYEELKRFNVIFPVGLLSKIDKYRKGKGLKRSTLLRKAAEEFLENHDADDQLFFYRHSVPDTFDFAAQNMSFPHVFGGNPLL